MKKTSLIGLLLIMLLAAIPAGAYTVYLKDGAKLIAKEPPEIRGNMAIITLQNGTQSSLDASEIDIERTREANQNELGSALLLEGGEFTAETTAPEPKREERLSDLIRKNRAEARPRSRSPEQTRSTSSESSRASSAEVDLLDWQRGPLRNLDVVGEIQGVFRGQGVEQTRLYQGTSPDRALVDLTTDSEAAVFRGLRVAATALVHVQTKYPGTIDALELVLLTSDRLPAGQFLLEIEDASRLADGDLEPSAFFVEHVRF